MSSLIENQTGVNEAVDQSCPSSCPRRYEQLRRTLGIIDHLAPLRHHQTTHEIAYRLNDRWGTSWSFRTIERDLFFLAEAGLVERAMREDFASGGTRTSSWKLSLRQSELGQTAAIKLLDNPAPVAKNNRWSVHLIDVETGDVECVWTGLSKREVMLRWRAWNEGRTNCVLIAWPQWMPPFAHLAKDFK